MFDLSIVVSFDSLPQTPNFEILSFPDDVEPQKYFVNTKWFKLNYYAHETCYHQWIAENDKFLILSLGQVFFRFDSSYRANQSSILSELLLIDNTESILRMIKGNFVLFIFNKSDRTFSIISSKSCHYDIYYTRVGTAYFITSSLRTLLDIDGQDFKESPVSIIETSLFDYPLGRATLYDGVYHLDQGTIVDIGRSGLRQNKYHDWVHDIHNRQVLYTWKDTYRQVIPLFNDVVKMQTLDKPKLISALTSGFDSRTLLSAFMKQHTPGIKYYSWGRSDQVDVCIPSVISQKMHLDYSHCSFDDDFHADYVKSAMDAIEYSNGRATLRRAHHFFYYKKLSKHSNYNFTGLYGSELLRPISTIGHMFNKSFLNVLLDGTTDSIREEIIGLKENGFLSSDFIDANADATILHIKGHLDNVRSDLPDYLALLNFTLSHGLMKYFGHEVHGTRSYVFTYSPYLDDEFIEFILKTPTVDLDREAMLHNMKKDIWNTRRGQMMYLPIIKKNCHQLMNIPTGRHYSPSQLISPLYPLSVFPALIKKKFGRINSSFGSERWITKLTDEFKGRLIRADIRRVINLPTYDLQRFETYAKHLSLSLWLSGLCNSSKDLQQ